MFVAGEGRRQDGAVLLVDDLNPAAKRLPVRRAGGVDAVFDAGYLGEQVVAVVGGEDEDDVGQRVRSADDPGGWAPFSGRRVAKVPRAQVQARLEGGIRKLGHLAWS